MNYEQKKTKVGFAVLEASKFVIGPSNAIIDPYSDIIKDIPANEVKAILMQFEAESKISIEYMPRFINEFIPDIHKRYLYEVKVLDIAYFKSFIPHESPIKALNKFTEEITGQTAEERARIKAIENAVKEKELSPNVSEYFIDYKDDKVIMLNGKIDIGRPHFGEDNQIVFEFLYNHPNQVFTEKELLEKTNAKVIGKLTKIVESLGFRRGLGKAFFEINTTSIKFKNHIKL